MPKRTDTLVAGEYFLAVQGLALIRTCLTDPTAGRPRVEEMRAIIDHFAEFPHALEIAVTEHEVDDGYTRWAPRYDGPNPAIATEEPVVRAILDELPPGVALDAACGTGRHAAWLAGLGHDVIGVDANDAMLAIARAKVPTGDFRRGRLENLPVEDASVDVATCALALTHVSDLGPVMAELARVLKPGGQAVLSDIHPFATMTGSIAGFPDEDITAGIPYVQNLTHPISAYVTAFRAAGLTVLDCAEPVVGDEVVRMYPSFAIFPEATRQAFLGTPYLLVWRLSGT